MRVKSSQVRESTSHGGLGAPPSALPLLRAAAERLCRRDELGPVHSRDTRPLLPRASQQQHRRVLAASGQHAAVMVYRAVRVERPRRRTQHLKLEARLQAEGLACALRRTVFAKLIPTIAQLERIGM